MTSIAVSIQSAARMTDVSETTLRKAINTQQLPAYRVGRAIRIRTADLDEWLASLTRVGSDDDR